MFNQALLLGSGQPLIRITVPTNTTNYDAFVAAGSPVFPIDLEVIVNPGVRVSSDGSGPAMSFAGFHPNSRYFLTVSATSTVYGHGGFGGEGGSAGVETADFTVGIADDGEDGGVGGDAVSSDRAIEVVNSGEIRGGGGGGGGGGGYVTGNAPVPGRGGGGGQGVQGGAFGVGGDGFSNGSQVSTGQSGQAGSESAPGEGGLSGADGDGGAWGAQGEDGYDSLPSQSNLTVGGTGGAGGFSVRCSAGSATITGSGVISGVAS